MDVRSAFLYGKIVLSGSMCLNHQVLLDPKFLRGLQVMKSSIWVTPSSPKTLAYSDSDMLEQNLEGNSTTGEPQNMLLLDSISLQNNAYCNSAPLIRDAYEKKLSGAKINTDDNVADLLTKHLMLKNSGGNHGGQSSSDKSLSGNEGGMTLQSVYDLCISLCTRFPEFKAKEIKHLKAQIKKLKKQAKLVITHHRASIKSISLKQRLAGKKTLKANWMHKESLDDDEIDNMDTEDAQDVGRTREVVDEEKEGTKDAVSTEDVVRTDKEKVSTDRSKDSTDKEEEGTDKDKDSTVC
ncbi:hypothetical protein Tco_0559956 [Tanacetum coccineum]